MRRILLLAVTCCVLASCGGKRGNKPSATTHVTDLKTTPYYYLQLKGTIGNEHITMQLIKSGPLLFKGYYVYDNVGEPIMVWGNPDDDEIVLYENTDPTEERTFKGRLDSAGVFKGKWRGKGTTYEFTLQPDFAEATPLDVYYSVDSVNLLPGNPNTPIGEASNCIVWPAAATEPSVADFIKKSISGGRQVADVAGFVKRDIDSFLVTYKTTARDLDTTEGIPATASWSADADMKVVWNRYPLLVFEYFSYEYTGGAHGNYGAQYQVLDLEKKKILTLDDVFRADYKKVLVPELEKAFRRIYKLEPERPLSSILLEKEISPNNNFLITDKGVAFSYTPYEIGPYAMGQVTLFIPFKDIESVLKK